MNSETFTPKFAVLLLFAAVGIVPLARLVTTRSPLRWPARAAVAFLAVALVSALVSPSPNIGFFGLYLWGTGWLFWLGAAGAFAIGASLGPKDRRWLSAGLLFGAVRQCLVAVFQIVRNAQTAGLSLYRRQAGARVSGKPDPLGGAPPRCDSRSYWEGPAGHLCAGVLSVLVLALGLEFTFERFALAILVLLVLYALYTYGARRGGAFALLIGAGYGIAYLVVGPGSAREWPLERAKPPSDSDSECGCRGAHYVLHHPLLGVGPGQLRTGDGLEGDTFLLPARASWEDADRRHTTSLSRSE